MFTENENSVLDPYSDNQRRMGQPNRNAADQGSHHYKNLGEMRDKCRLEVGYRAQPIANKLRRPTGHKLFNFTSTTIKPRPL
jgi:hypothetical protein